MNPDLINRSFHLRPLPALFLVTVTVAGAGWLTSLLAWMTAGVTVFSVHLALAFGFAIRFGLGHALAGGLGTALYLWSAGEPAPAVLQQGVGLVIAGMIVRSIYLRLRPRCKTEILRRSLYLNLACFVFVPLVSLAVVFSQAHDPLPAVGPFQGFWREAFFMALSTILFSPLVVTWVKKTSNTKANAAVWFGHHVAKVVLVLIAVLFALALVLGQEKAFLAGQGVLFLALALAAIPVIVGSERTSATTIAFVSTVFVLEQVLYVQTGALLIQLGVEARLVILSCAIFLGAVIGHVLNALATENTLQRVAIIQQPMKNSDSGLYNRRSFFKAVNEITSNKDRETSEFFAEIAIPDLEFWADFSGRQAAYQFDARIVEQVAYSLQEHANLVAHAMFGSYFVHLKPGADKLVVVNAIQHGVREACAMHGVKGMTLRSKVALLSVPHDVQANTEDILATLSHTLHRANLGVKGWAMVTLQADLLKQQRDEALEGEALVDALSSGSVCIFTQTILSVEGLPAKALSDKALADQDLPESGLHFEVLARLKSHEGHFISPARFLPVYAACGLLPQFDREVIRTLFECFERQRAVVQDIAACSINLTGPTLSDPDLVSFIEARFEGAVIQPRQVVFEITESDRITNLEQALDNIAELKRLGCTIALDDFGTGLASFDYLKRFQPDWLKIDGSFVRPALGHAVNTEVVASMVRVAKAAGMKVVAEQVEDQACIDLMKSLGVHYVQGYAVSKPQPIEDMIAASVRRPGPAGQNLTGQNLTGQNLARVEEALGI